jgi:hypothetical protein
MSQPVVSTIFFPFLVTKHWQNRQLQHRMMNVDRTMASGSKRRPSPLPSLPASTSKRPKHDPIPIQLMRQLASVQNWHAHMDMAKDDEVE